MKILPASGLLAVWLICSCDCFAEEPVIDFKSNFYPTSTTHQIVRHKYYTLSYKEANEQAEWVAYLLTAAMPTSEFDRRNNFRPDPLVKTGSAELADYTGSNFDRGHLCPAEDMSFSKEAISETFYLSNMSPQNSSFNRGIWSKLEAKVRDWVLTYDSLYIVTGGVLTSDLGKIGRNKVSVPRYYYKIILHYTRDDIRMIAFLLPNKKVAGSLAQYVVATDSIEQLTGIDFFQALPDLIESKLESDCDTSKWGPF
ncbi:MAG: DNA/RNA non-specific endonuclease [Bacteroidales bacterium]|nr:DNA/RNA non-specific endonuclease [Bacteroidales bacterium]